MNIQRSPSKRKKRVFTDIEEEKEGGQSLNSNKISAPLNLLEQYPAPAEEVKESSSISEEDYSELDRKIQKQRRLEKDAKKGKQRTIGKILKETTNYQVHCELQVKKIKMPEEVLSGLSVSQMHISFKYNHKNFSTKNAHLGKKMNFGNKFQLMNIHQHLDDEDKTSFLQFVLVSNFGEVLGSSEGFFFEELIISTEHGVEETSKLPIFSDLLKLGTLEICTKITSVGNPPKELQEQILRTKQILADAQDQQSFRLQTVEDDKTKMGMLLQIHEVQEDSIGGEFKPWFVIQKDNALAETEPPSKITDKLEGSMTWDPPLKVWMRFDSDQDMIALKLMNRSRSGDKQVGICALQIQTLLMPSDMADSPLFGKKSQAGESHLICNKHGMMVGRVRLSAELFSSEEVVDISSYIQMKAPNKVAQDTTVAAKTKESALFDPSNHRNAVSKKVTPNVSIGDEATFYSRDSVNDSQRNTETVEFMPRESGPSQFLNVLEIPKPKARHSPRSHRSEPDLNFGDRSQQELEKHNAAQLFMPTLVEHDERSEKSRSSSRSKARSKKSRASKAPSRMSKAGGKSTKGSTGGSIPNDFKKLFGGNVDEEKLQAYFAQFIDLVKTGQLEELTKKNISEPPSYKKLLKTIAESHPVHPKNKQSFSLKDRVTVKDYEQKLYDAFYFYFCRKKMNKCCKFIKRKCKGEPLQKFTKPESLKYLPDSSSSSSGSEVDDGDINGLTLCFTKIGFGAALYLQTLKTLLILFVILSVLNIPIFAMYASNTENNNYLDLFGTSFRYFTVGNLGETKTKCGYTSMIGFTDHNHAKNKKRELLAVPASQNLQLVCPADTYISEVKNLGFLYLEDKRTNVYSNGEAFCSEINHPGKQINSSLLIEIEQKEPEEEEPSKIEANNAGVPIDGSMTPAKAAGASNSSNPGDNPNLNGEASTNSTEEDAPAPEDKSNPLPILVEMNASHSAYDYCSSDCLALGNTYCVDSNFDYSSAVCFESKPSGLWLDIEGNKSYSEEAEGASHFHCINEDDYPDEPSFANYICPNHPVCYSSKLHIPAYGDHIQYLDKIGFVEHMHRDQAEIASTTIPKQCSFIVSANSRMKEEDVLWVEYAENQPFSQQVDISVYFTSLGNLTDFDPEPVQPFLTQHLMVQSNQSVLVRVEWGDDIDAATNELVLNTWTTKVNPKKEFTYTPDMLSYNKTHYNLDTQCREDKLFTDPIAIQKFNSFFDGTCKNRQKCSISFDSKFNFDQLISDECKYRITDLGVTSHELLMVVGCKQDWIYLLPFTSLTVHKQNAGMMIIAIEIISILVVVFFLQKLKQLNQEYINVVDDLTVQMQDFGIMFKDLQLDKYTQDTQIMRMKLWLHLHDALKPRRTRDNKLEILDITFSPIEEHSVQVLFRMQAVQEQINGMNEKVFKGELNDFETQRIKNEIEGLELKMKRLKEQYKQIISRGLHFSKEEIRYKPRSKRVEQVKYAFVVFKHCMTADLVLEYMETGTSFQSWLKDKLMPSSGNLSQAKTFCSNPLRIKPIVNPQEIIWQNFQYPVEEQYFRKISIIVIAAVFVVLNMILYVYLQGLQVLVENKLPTPQCPNQHFTKADAYRDELREVSNGLMECYCQREISIFTFWKLVTITFFEFDIEDSHRYCLYIFLKQSARVVVFTCVSLMVVIVNEAISRIFLHMGHYSKRYTKLEDQRSSFNQIFLLEFINTGLIALLIGFDFVGIQEILLGENEIFEREVHLGFSPAWYGDVGQFIAFSLFISAFIVNVKEFLVFLVKALNRCRDRGYSTQVKKDIEDEDDDTPNTKLKLQSELEELYMGKEFEGEKAFSRLTSTVFVILMFSSGMPVMYLIGIIFCAFTFYTSKLLILKFYRTSNSLSRVIPDIAVHSLKYAIIVHICLGCIMLTNPLPFDAKDQPSSQGWDSFLTFNLDTLKELQILEQENLGDKTITQSQIVVQLFDRLKFFHQQIYILFLLVFAFIYVIWKSLYNLIIFIVITTSYVIVKFFHGTALCIRRSFKKLVCKVRGTIYIDTEESVLFTPSEEEDENLSESSDEDDDEADEAAAIKLDLKITEQRKTLNNLIVRKSTLTKSTPGGQRSPDQKEAMDDLEAQILEVENALMRKEALRKQRQKKREIRLARRKELQALIRQKRMARADYSENILLEFSIVALQQFYERACKELRQFRDVFHQQDELPEDMLDPESESELRTNFLELCFVNRITTEQVIRYQKLLMRRIRDIEDIIDQHFNMIKPNLIQDVKNIYANERKRIKKEGIELTLQQQITMEKDEQNAMVHHPDVQFDNPVVYTYTKKLKKLLIHDEDLIQNDINRVENRRGVQEILRMEKSFTQSYFYFDCQEYKIARELYFEIEPENHMADDQFINEMMQT